MNCNHLNKRFPSLRCLSAVLTLAAALTAFPAKAEWKTETITLAPGWNAVFLHVDLSYEDLDVLLQRTPISRVEMWAPSSSTAQFVTSVQDTNSFGSSWVSWDNDSNDGVESVLQMALGNAAYLVYVEDSYEDGNTETISVTESNPFVWNAKGRVVPPSYTWTASGQNFIGFSTHPDSPPVFENFLALAPVLDTSSTEIYYYPGGELGSSNPLLVDAPITTPVTRGQAYWVRDDDYNRFFTPFAISLQDSSGVHFGTKLSQYRIRISNEANTAQTVTLQLVDSETPADGSTLAGTPAVLVRGELSATDFTYAFTQLADGSVSWDLAADGEIDSSVEVVLGIDRSAMTGSEGEVYGAILRFTDNFGSSGGYAQVDLPVSAEVGSLAGLWVGEAEITQVQQDLTEYEVDDDGATALNDDGSSVVSSLDTGFGGVDRSFSLRLIMHVDTNNVTRLLQRVYYGENSSSVPILATTQGLLNPDRLDIARRITAIHLPWTESNESWEFDAGLGLTSTMSTTVGVGYADTQSNPFLHIYHPDHDNKDAEFSTTPLARGYESFDIERVITLNAGTTLVTSDSSSSSSASSSDTSTETSTTLPSLPSGINLIDLPRGVFVMGDATADATVTTAPVPERSVNISAFKMSDAEITVQQYVDFLNAAAADGLISVDADSEGTFVFGASGQAYAGLKFVELSGLRTVEDQDGDGDLDPESPLNQCWISYDAATGAFSVKDPSSIDWENYDYSTGVGLSSSEWGKTVSTVELAIDGTPTVISDGDVENGLTNALDGALQVIVSDGFAYVVSAGSGALSVFDVTTTPGTPQLVQQVTGLDDVRHVRVVGGYAYVTARDIGSVLVYPVAELTDPDATVTEAGRVANNDDGGSTRISQPNCSAVLEADGKTYLYVVGEDDYLVLFDITTLGAPELKAEVQLTDGTTTYENLRWIEIADGVAYLTAAGDGNESSVVLVDVGTDPATPSFLNSIDDSDAFPGSNAYSLIISDDTLYVSSARDDAISIINVADKQSPFVMSVIQDGVDGVALNSPLIMALSEDQFLYAPGRFSDSVNVVDVSNPYRPELVALLEQNSGGFTALDSVNGVAVDDNYAYFVAGNSDALTTVQLTKTTVAVSVTNLLSATTPSIVSHGNTDANSDEIFALEGAQHVVVADGIAYVASFTSKNISILDVSNPFNVEILHVLEDEVDGNKLDGVLHLSLAGDLLVATADQSGESDVVSIYDISEPSAPIRKKIITDNTDAASLNIPYRSTISGDRLFVTSVEDVVTIFDISEPSAPELIGEIVSNTTDKNGNTFKVGNGHWIEVFNDIAYVAANQDGRVQIIDVSDPANPFLLSEIVDGDGFNYLANPECLIVDGNTLYIASGAENAVTIVDIRDPERPALLREIAHGDGTYSALGNPRWMTLDDQVLYVPATDSDAVTVIDVSDPAAPVLLEELVNGDGDHTALDGTYSVAVDAGQVYIAAFSASSLSIISPELTVGESIANWPELTDNLPTASDVADWPVTFVKWHGAKVFAEYYGCDLPTEAQWEYAASGGIGYAYGTVDGGIDASLANYNGHLGRVAPVKSHSPNPFGLYDLSGNVSEWCRDWFDPGFYSASPDPDYDPFNDALYLGATEPVEDSAFVGGPDVEFNGDARVVRGGGWRLNSLAQAAARRERDYTWRGDAQAGFRIVQAGSYTIEPVTATSFTALTSTSTKLTGTYQEKITLKGKDEDSKEYNIAGEFSLIRISDISELNQE